MARTRSSAETNEPDDATNASKTARKKAIPKSIRSIDTQGKIPIPSSLAVGTTSSKGGSTSATTSAGAVAVPVSASAPEIVDGEGSDGTALRSKRTRDSRGREPRKRTRRGYIETLTLFVGKNSDQFIVHKDRICKASPYFAAACSKEWLEGQTGVVRLPEQSGKYFRHYVEWVYSRRVDLEELDQELRHYANTRRSQTTTNHLLSSIPLKLTHAYCKVWVIADYLGDIACKNECMQQVLKNADELWFPGILLKTTQFVADKVETDSGLFAWMTDHIADIFIWHASRELTPQETKAADERRNKFIDDLPVAVKEAVLKTVLKGQKPGLQQDFLVMDVTKYQELADE